MGKRLIKMEPHGIWLHRNLALAITIVTLVSVIVSLAVKASDIINEVDYQENRLNQLEQETKQNTKALNDINSRLSSIDTNIEFIKKELTEGGN